MIEAFEGIDGSAIGRFEFLPNSLCCFESFFGSGFVLGEDEDEDEDVNGTNAFNDDQRFFAGAGSSMSGLAVSWRNDSIDALLHKKSRRDSFKTWSCMKWVLCNRRSRQQIHQSPADHQSTEY